MEILLHTEKLSQKSVAALERGGVVAVHVKDLNSFKFVSAQVHSLPMDNLLWACLNAAVEDNSMGQKVAVKLVKNLALLAAETRAERQSEGQEAGR